MKPMGQILPIFIKKVDAGAYPAVLLNDIGALSQQIANDLNENNADEAKNFLGYLLDKGYVEIKPNQGIILKRSDPDIAEIIKKILST